MAWFPPFPGKKCLPSLNPTATGCWCLIGRPWSRSCLYRPSSLPRVCPVCSNFTPIANVYPREEAGHEYSSWFWAKIRTSWREIMPELLAHRPQGSIIDNRSWHTEGVWGRGWEGPGSFRQQHIGVGNRIQQKGAPQCDTWLQVVASWLKA